MDSLSPDPEDLQRLKAFIISCRANPGILHNPHLNFFKDYIKNIEEQVSASIGINSEIVSAEDPVSLMEEGGSDGNHGANDINRKVVPKYDNKQPTEEEMGQAIKDYLKIIRSKVPTNSKKQGSTPIPKVINILKVDQETALKESKESNIKFENYGIIEAERVAMPGYGDVNKEPTEEDIDQATEKRSEAMSAMSDGELHKAINLLTEAIKLNPTSVMLYVKRGNILLKQKRVNACIKDCDIAIKLYPGSASAFKLRGRAHRLLGHWEVAEQDLKVAWKLDFDEEVDEWLKELNQTLTKLDKHKLKCDQKCAGKKQKKNKKRVFKKYAVKEKTKDKNYIQKPTKKSFHCNQCDKAFSHNYSLKYHLRIHTGENPYQCSQCDKAYKKKSRLRRHMMIHTGEKPYQCQHCDMAFSTKEPLTVHTMKVHTGEKPHKCSQCEKAYIKSADLKRHMPTHTGEKPFQCSQCGNTFITNKELKSHMLIHTGERPFQCDQCDKKFTHNHHLKGHMSVHNGKSYLCNLCGKDFSLKRSFKVHMQIHNGDLPYQCNQCDKALPNKTYLNEHIKRAHTHTHDRPFQCPHCDTNFKRNSGLTSHLIIHTVREKQHKCSLCEKAFLRPESLAVHMRIHSEDRKSKVTVPWERPFKCTQCTKAYKRKTDLTFHMKIHTGERSYQCSYCEKIFTLQCTLISHMTTHTGEKRLYQCNHCDNSYAFKCHLRFHMKSHPDEKTSSNENIDEGLAL